MGSEPDLTHPHDRNKQSSSSKDFNLESSFRSLNSTTSSVSSSSYHTAREGQEGTSSSASTSVYFTPAGSTGDNGSGGGIDQLGIKGKKSNKKSAAALEGEGGSGGGDSVASLSSGTLEGAESIHSSTLDELEECSEENKNSGMVSPDRSSRLSSSSPSSENAIEVREDISRLCNTIAESEGFDSVKKSRIEFAIRAGDLKELGQLAMGDGGLLSNTLRTKAWPLLLKVSAMDITKNECKMIPTFYPDVPEKIVDLVNMDVARVLKRFPPGLTDPQQDHLQLYLNNLICSVLQENPRAYYYQGFHDISLTFLLVSISQRAPYLAYLCLNKMIETNLDPYMERTMERTNDVIHVLLALLEKEDPALYKKIAITCQCPVAFCLPWVLTWFSHTLPYDTDVFRLYDFILGAQEKLRQPYLIPIFVSATLLLRRAQTIKDDDSLTDIASMHHRLSKLPSELDSLDPWLTESLQLMKKYQGQEETLLRRALEIKAIQNRLWNEDNNNQVEPIPRNAGLVKSVGRFLFVRHRWTTVSLIVLGTAFLLQSKYNRSIYRVSTLRALAQSYAPQRFQNAIEHWLVDESNDE